MTCACSQDGEPVVEQVFETGSLSEDSAPLLEALARHGPYDLVYGPSGYGLPLVAAADVGERELAEMVLVRPDEARADAGVGGMRSLLRALAGSGLPVVFGPGVIHLPSVPRHRKYNRIDLGTADKVCAAACAIVDQSTRRAIEPRETSMVLLELGGAFTAALAIAGGQIVDGMGGSSGPLGVRAAGAPGRRARVPARAGAAQGHAVQRRRPGSGRRPRHDRPGGAVGLTRPRGRLDGAARGRGQGGARPGGQRAGAARDRRLRPSGPPARADRGARPRRWSDIAPVVALVPGRASAAAHGGALLADALAGGRNAALAEVLRLRESSGTALDHLRVAGAEAISLG